METDLLIPFFAEKADERDAILAEHFVAPFRAPSVGATESEWVLLPRARTLCWGRPSGGTDKAESRVPQGAGL
jgi:hypothetical protein